MPEGPEVQQVLNSIEPKVLGKIISEVSVLHPKITMPLRKIGRQEVETFSQRLEGGSIEKLERKGKYLIFNINQVDISTLYLVTHLGMTGAIFHVNNLDEIAPNYRKHVHLIFKLNDESLMVYSDQRRFGWMGALNEQEYTAYRPLQEVGPDPASEDAPKLFLEIIRNKTFINKPIKRVIMQPNVIQGVGNIYASECLYKAKLNPLTSVGEISDEKLLELLVHIKETFELAIKLGGSSIRDYVNSEGKKGTFQELHMVYNKDFCPECGVPIENLKIDQRSSFYCPNCQAKS
ncbi:bifunctional DNA-formamidopyrimidine glycosylase/DNA-(apurinic or apyrimidinic site) lyase [Cytobacillus sp. IB215665]|uniref:bifunctional DNA-formamidopyrimidine glycosylase/DNA-(apurinic or apyrimidinic site) lyase n=1 Tax=Cytobacillus sp. IB215665 TaxID=3097357 RepID=UPI002A162934|nr:bifunctional DNA-formamidopyrimidine glycosylase/DNA-(apurinic or apyrimidinic site) lyase [Cytobacillus sp. IB215665]MDX8363963.1 bifunctional DNA-formamidopyrimidine glycosylase/DNA-(apurinic or apyrimidinic site) lyase [Cytobacillus sp. IB215665]